ncbi:MAG: PSD1 domain-containing protein [Planctomycetales bacterium]|nr:PSD1 domain-containing protein [Planctomycetales bacterium]
MVQTGSALLRRRSGIVGIVFVAFLLPYQNRGVCGQEASGDESNSSNIQQPLQVPERSVKEKSVDLFQASVLPILAARCYRCHSSQAAEPEAGLLLDSALGLATGGETGRVVVPGHPEESLLIEAILSEDNPMPPDERLSQLEITTLTNWIALGAEDPRGASATVEITDPDYTLARQYWAFRPVEEQVIPPVQNEAWPSNTIDRFVLAKLEQNGLQPAPVASARTLLRRLYFDVTGLPPTPGEVAEFEKDSSDAHYAKVVDRLLDSPRYGERFAQLWLDLVRFAETEGFEYDREMNGIWRYRDYVIQSFNNNKPYNQFLMEQLAGDEMAPNDFEHRIAAGFLRLGAVRRNAGNQKVASSRNEVLTERTDIVGSVVLGMTIGCARCHDHKFDAIPQQDYYRLQAYFAASVEDDVSMQDDAQAKARQKRTAELEREIDELKATIANLDGAAEETARLQIAELEAQIPPPGPTICSITNEFEPEPVTHLLRRGDPNLPGPVVGMQTPGVVTRENSCATNNSTTPRTNLAKELTRPDHPLTARVMVNRIWQHHFGSGIVSTANDFGKNGSGPSHPELLDYLANRFVSSDWNIKTLHREILLSNAYRQSSQSADNFAGTSVDPANRLLWRFSRRRLSGEEIRDAMLSVSGELNLGMAGASILLPVEQQLIDQLYKPTQWEVTANPQEHNRRSVYLMSKRNLRLPFMEVFDQPSAQTSCASRVQSTHARQSLELLNGDISNRLAESFARRLEQECESTHGRVELAYQLIASRFPTDKEAEISRCFIERFGLSEFALAMFNVNAFLYVD